MLVQYNCKNCGAEIKPNDIYCSNCGRKLSDVGRTIKLEIKETLNLSEPKKVSNALSSSFALVSADVATTGSLLDAIPKENREAVGIDDHFYGEFKKVKDRIQKLQELQPFIDLRGSTINAPLYVSQGGDNIVLSLNIDDSLNKLTQEIEKSDIDSEMKAIAKSKAGELKAEITKQDPNVSTIRRIYAELKSIVPVALAAAQLGTILGKFLVGGS